jgi:iron-sulfur cluster repair protein YtfE (RIC family)
MITMDMVNRLRESLEGKKDFEELSLEEKIDDIKRCHHEKELIQIKTILDKMKTYEEGNKKRDSKIEEIFQAFRAMSKELKTHFELEEIEVFPLLISRAYQENEMRKVIMDMQSDHGKTEEYIYRIDDLTGHYLYMAEDPELARIYREMQALFADISTHIGKEDNSLWAEFS